MVISKKGDRMKEQSDSNEMEKIKTCLSYIEEDLHRIGTTMVIFLALVIIGIIISIVAIFLYSPQ